MAVEKVVGASEHVSSQAVRQGKVAKWLQSWMTIMKAKPLGALGGFLILLLVLTAIFAPALAPSNPIQIS